MRGVLPSALWRRFPEEQLLIQRALLEDRFKTFNQSLDIYEKSLPRFHVTPDRTSHDSNNLAELSSFTELSRKFDEVIRFAENYLAVNPNHKHESKTVWVWKKEGELRQ